MIGRLVLVALLCAGSARAERLIAPQLGAASNFGQGVNAAAIAALKRYEVRGLRDGLNWNRAETKRGVYDFDQPRLAYPAGVAASGATLTVTLNWGNNLYDAGNTPHSPAAIAAFAAFAAQLARRYPGVDAIEVGNEFNGTNFVKGPLKKMRPAERAAAYTQILTATYQAAKAVRRDIRILGGATHSIPAGYLWQVFDAGGAGRMDALAIHPYTTPAEQFVRQIGVLRRHPRAVNLPIEITEFGEPDKALSVGYFLRNYCQFALGGVSHAVWYPLTARGDGFVPLFDPSGAATPVGLAFRYADQNFTGQPVSDAAPDTFTYGCKFGSDHIVLWGAPRPFNPQQEVAVLNAIGAPVPKGPLMLSETDPMIFHREGGIDLARDLGLAKQTVVADTYDQFAYPEADGTPPETDGFQPLIRSRGRDSGWITLPGQEAQGTPWTPYLGAEGNGTLRLTAETLLPGSNTDIVHRYVADRDARLTLLARFAPGAESRDGITVQITRNGTEIAAGKGKKPIALELPGIAVEKGDEIEVVVGAGPTAAGDLSSYRITLTQP